MKSRTSFACVMLLALVSSAASGSAPIDGATLRVGNAVSDFERVITRITDEQRALETELASIDPRLETVRKRMLARGRAYYRHVHAGLLPVG
jgi:hypothetical protein